MYFTKLGLTQYQAHDNPNFLDRYNKDMQIITQNSSSIGAYVQQSNEDTERMIRETQQTISATNRLLNDASTSIGRLYTAVYSVTTDARALASRVDVLEITTSSISRNLTEHIINSTSYSAFLLKEIKQNKAAQTLTNQIVNQKLEDLETASTNHDKRLQILEKGTPDVTASINRLELAQMQTDMAIDNIDKSLQQLNSNDSTQAFEISNLKSTQSTQATQLKNLQNAVDNVQTLGEQVNKNTEDIKSMNVSHGLQNGKVTLDVVLKEQFSVRAPFGIIEANVNVGNVAGSTIPSIYLRKPTDYNDDIYVPILIIKNMVSEPGRRIILRSDGTLYIGTLILDMNIGELIVDIQTDAFISSILANGGTGGGIIVTELYKVWAGATYLSADALYNKITYTKELINNMATIQAILSKE